MRASDAGLSTTTTSSGLFDDARTSPQVPSSTVTRDAVDGDEVANRLAGERLASRLHRLETARRRDPRPRISPRRRSAGDMVGEPQVLGRSR